MYRAERWEYRLRLSHVDRGVDLASNVIVGRHPSETTGHLALRMLAYCFLYEEAIEFGPGLCAGDAPDLFANDLTGKLRLWIGCGEVAPDLARKVVQHNRDAQVHIVHAKPESRDGFLERVRAWPRPPRGWENLTLWLVPPALVEALGALDRLRQDWTVTIVGDHLYVEVDGVFHEGPLVSLRGPQ
jgi:uncharacterized protein YaeQ